MKDPISDLLTRIRNAQMSNKAFIKLSSSIMKIAILKVLKDEGYIENFKKYEILKNKIELEVILKYYNNKPVISKITRVSKPGLRIYKKIINLPKVLGGLGIAVISTSYGVISDKKAKKLGQGGEILCFGMVVEVLGFVF